MPDSSLLKKKLLRELIVNPYRLLKYKSGEGSWTVGDNAEPNPFPEEEIDRMIEEHLADNGVSYGAHSVFPINGRFKAKWLIIDFDAHGILGDEGGAEESVELYEEAKEEVLKRWRGLRWMFAPGNMVGGLHDHMLVTHSGRGLHLMINMTQYRDDDRDEPYYLSARNVRFFGRLLASLCFTDWELGAIEVFPKEKELKSAEMWKNPGRGVRMPFGSHPSIPWHETEIIAGSIENVLFNPLPWGKIEHWVRDSRESERGWLQWMRRVNFQYDRYSSDLYNGSIGFVEYVRNAVDEYNDRNDYNLSEDVNPEMVRRIGSLSAGEALDRLPLCLRQFIREAGDEEHPYQLIPSYATGNIAFETRAIICISLFLEGMSRTDMVDLFSGLKNFDRKKTEVQVQGLYDWVTTRNLRRISCPTLASKLSSDRCFDRRICARCHRSGAKSVGANLCSHLGEQLVEPRTGRIIVDSDVRGRDGLSEHIRESLVERREAPQKKILHTAKTQRAGFTTTFFAQAKELGLRPLGVFPTHAIPLRTISGVTMGGRVLDGTCVASLWEEMSGGAEYTSMGYFSNRDMCPAASDAEPMESRNLFPFVTREDCEDCPNASGDQCPHKMFMDRYNLADSNYFTYAKLGALIKSDGASNERFLDELCRSIDVVFLDEVSHVLDGNSSQAPFCFYEKNSLNLQIPMHSVVEEISKRRFAGYMTRRGKRFADIDRYMSTREVEEDEGGGENDGDEPDQPDEPQTNAMEEMLDIRPGDEPAAESSKPRARYRDLYVYFKRIVQAGKSLRNVLQSRLNRKQVTLDSAFTFEVDNGAYVGNQRDFIELYHTLKDMFEYEISRSGSMPEAEYEQVLADYKYLLSYLQTFGSNESLFIQHTIRGRVEPSTVVYGMENVNDLIHFVRKLLDEYDVPIFSTDGIEPPIPISRIFGEDCVDYDCVGDPMGSAEKQNVLVHTGQNLYTRSSREYTKVKEFVLERSAPDLFLAFGNSTEFKEFFGVETASHIDEMREAGCAWISVGDERKKIEFGGLDWARGKTTVGVASSCRTMIFVGSPAVPHDSLAHKVAYLQSEGYIDETESRFNASRCMENHDAASAFAQTISRVKCPNGVEESEVHVFGIPVYKVEQYLSNGVPMAMTKKVIHVYSSPEYDRGGNVVGYSEETQSTEHYSRIHNYRLWGPDAERVMSVGIDERPDRRIETYYEDRLQRTLDLLNEDVTQRNYYPLHPSLIKDSDITREVPEEWRSILKLDNPYQL